MIGETEEEYDGDIQLTQPYVVRWGASTSPMNHTERRKTANRRLILVAHHDCPTSQSENSTKEEKLMSGEPSDHSSVDQVIIMTLPTGRRQNTSVLAPYDCCAVVIGSRPAYQEENWSSRLPQEIDRPARH